MPGDHCVRTGFLQAGTVGCWHGRMDVVMQMQLEL